MATLSRDEGDSPVTTLDSLSPDTRDLLDKFGFEPELFERRRQAVADGSLCDAANIVQGQLEAPGSDAWDDTPKEGSEEAEAAGEEGRRAIERGEVGVIILNGGMATRFGGVVKGIVEALPGRSFLALKVQQIQRECREVGGRVPCYLMNSFATDEATKEHFEDHRNFGLAEEDLEFYTQGISLRMTPKGDIFLDAEGNPSCHGPGHGDCPIFFKKSGCLERFMDAGGKYLLISNVDNLAARLDPTTLGMHIMSGKDLSAEVAPKWPGDKGGSPCYVDGKLWVVEGFRFPADFDQDQIPVFNTNTFTINAEALAQDFELTDCYVSKKVGDHDAVQIETLIGELTRFMPTGYVKVKRTGPACRFFPIKTQQDLIDGREDLELICS